MKNEYSVKDKLTLFLLMAGVICFGVVFPDSLSTHVKIVHFAAHFGMSFLLALSFYLVSTVKFRLSKAFAYTVLITSTLFIGVVYKFWEIASQGAFARDAFAIVIDRAGVMTSMSQNLSGLMGAMLLIEGLLDRNLIISLLRAGNLHVNSRGHIQLGKVQEKTTLGKIAVAKQFSPVTEN